MATIGVKMSADRADEEMSSHSSKAEWVMVVNTDNPVPLFVKNEALNGKSAVEIAIRQGCTDVILADIGDGALGHLQEAHIRAWAVPELISGNQALRMYKEAQLLPVPHARAATRHSAYRECCCSSQTESAATGCCRG
jgi:predicted Fe-Mo cluster-binding NifX family protein